MTPNRKPTAPESETETLSFEDAMTRLEGIVEALERGELSLEESITRYEEGMRLSRRLTQTLEQAEQRIERLVEGEKGQPPSTRPMELDLGGERAAEGDDLPF